MDFEYGFDPALLPNAHLGNELIAALGPPKTDAEVQNIFEKPIKYTPADRDLRDETRLQCVMGLNKLSVFLKRHLPLYRYIDGGLRDGYVGKEPAGSYQARQLAILHRKRRGNRPIAGEYGSIPNLSQFGLGWISIAGMGQLAALTLIAKSYPPYLYHPRWDVYQTPFLLLEIPAKGYSTFAMGDGILKALDQQIPYGSFYSTYGPKIRIAEERVPALLAVPLTVCSVGMMWWHGAQRMASVPRNKQDLSNVLIFTGNSVSTPLGISGTEDAARVINRSLEGAIRSAGIEPWRPLEEAEHYEYLQKLWAYDYTRKTPEINEYRLKLLRACSSGVIEIDILLLQCCQRAAILSKTESITDDLIVSVMEANLKALLPFIDAVHHKRYDLLGGMENQLTKLLTEFGEATPQDLIAASSNLYIPASSPAFIDVVSSVLRGFGMPREAAEAQAAREQDEKPTSFSGDATISAIKRAQGASPRNTKYDEAGIYKIPEGTGPNDYRHALVRAAINRTTVGEELVAMKVPAASQTK